MLCKPAAKAGLAGTAHTDQGNTTAIMRGGKILVQQLQSTMLFLAIEALDQFIDQDLLGGKFIAGLQQVGYICSQSVPLSVSRGIKIS